MTTWFPWTISAICLLGWIGNSAHWRKKYTALHSTMTVNTDMCVGWQNAANMASRGFLQSVRLLSIHRKGRLNYFTFIRGTGTPFIIETMGILADDLQEWEKQTGFVLEPSAPGTIMLVSYNPNNPVHQP